MHNRLAAPWFASLFLKLMLKFTRMAAREQGNQSWFGFRSANEKVASHAPVGRIK
jgi:hypothetical protein